MAQPQQVRPSVGNQKFAVQSSSHELTREEKERLMKPSSKARASAYRKLLESLARGERGEALKERAQVILADLVISEETTKSDTRYTEEFRAWLIGRSKWNDERYTPWGSKDLLHLVDVREYIDGFVRERMEVQQRLTELHHRGETRGIRNLPEAWLYFKFIVTGFNEWRAAGNKGTKAKERNDLPFLTYEGFLEFLDEFRMVDRTLIADDSIVSHGGALADAATTMAPVGEPPMVFAQEAHAAADARLTLDNIDVLDTESYNAAVYEAYRETWARQLDAEAMARGRAWRRYLNHQLKRGEIDRDTAATNDHYRLLLALDERNRSSYAATRAFTAAATAGARSTAAAQTATLSNVPDIGAAQALAAQRIEYERQLAEVKARLDAATEREAATARQNATDREAARHRVDQLMGEYQKIKAQVDAIPKDIGTVVIDGKVDPEQLARIQKDIDSRVKNAELAEKVERELRDLLDKVHPDERHTIKEAMAEIYESKSKLNARIEKGVRALSRVTELRTDLTREVNERRELKSRLTALKTDRTQLPWVASELDQARQKQAELERKDYERAREVAQLKLDLETAKRDLEARHSAQLASVVGRMETQLAAIREAHRDALLNAQQWQTGMAANFTDLVSYTNENIIRLDTLQGAAEHQQDQISHIRAVTAELSNVTTETFQQFAQVSDNIAHVAVMAEGAANTAIDLAFTNNAVLQQSLHVIDAGFAHHQDQLDQLYGGFQDVYREIDGVQHQLNNVSQLVIEHEYSLTWMNEEFQRIGDQRIDDLYSIAGWMHRIYNTLDTRVSSMGASVAQWTAVAGATRGLLTNGVPEQIARGNPRNQQWVLDTVDAFQAGNNRVAQLMAENPLANAAVDPGFREYLTQRGIPAQLQGELASWLHNARSRMEERVRGGEDPQAVTNEMMGVFSQFYKDLRTRRAQQPLQLEDVGRNLDPRVGQLAHVAEARGQDLQQAVVNVARVQNEAQQAMVQLAKTEDPAERERIYHVVEAKKTEFEEAITRYEQEVEVAKEAYESSTDDRPDAPPEAPELDGRRQDIADFTSLVGVLHEGLAQIMTRGGAEQAKTIIANAMLAFSDELEEPLLSEENAWAVAAFMVNSPELITSKQHLLEVIMTFLNLKKMDTQ